MSNSRELAIKVLQLQGPPTQEIITLAEGVLRETGIESSWSSFHDFRRDIFSAQPSMHGMLVDEKDSLPQPAETATEDQDP